MEGSSCLSRVGWTLGPGAWVRDVEGGPDLVTDHPGQLQKGRRLELHGAFPRVLAERGRNWAAQEKKRSLIFRRKTLS